jgi:hypothetical protein
MATVQLNLSYETLLDLIEQLPADQKRDLLMRLLEDAKNRSLSKEEKLALYHTSIISLPIKEEPSIRREDWYGDDGR